MSTASRPTDTSHPPDYGTAKMGIGFWIVAAAFLVAMAFSTIPTPLWSLYRDRDGLSTAAVTVAFAAYAAGVVISLLLAGHLSDRWGRKRLLLPALALEAVAGIMFLMRDDFPGLIAARIVTGLAVGIVTPTATAYLMELHGRARPGKPQGRASMVSTAANLGGLGLGPLTAGLLAQHVDRPLTLPYLVFLILLVLAVVGVAFVPESVALVSGGAYRPQKITVPRLARSRYFALAGAAAVAFAILGLFTSLAPAFLAMAGQQGSAAAGVSAFAVFAAAAVAQIFLGRMPADIQLRIGMIGMSAGSVVLAGSVAASSASGFITGGLLAGAGSGVLLRGSLTAAASLAPVHLRGEALAGVFLCAYLGLAVPILGLGAATAAGFPLDGSLVTFCGLLLAGLAAVTTTLRRHPAPTASQ